MQPIMMVLTFLVVAGATFLLLSQLDGSRSRAKLLKDRLAAIEQAQARASSEELTVLRDELLSGIPALNQFLSRSRRLSRLQPWLNQSGMKIRAGKFLLVCAATASVVGLIGITLLNSPVIAVLLFGIGALLPVMLFSQRRSQRFKRFEQLFPEAIDLLGRAVRAGHAFTTALELIGTESPEPIAGEFRKTFEEQKFGLPLRDSMLNMAERIPIVDVNFFVTAVMLQRETGGNLADILDKLAYFIRERFKIRRQVRVFTAQGRLTMYLLMALPPGCIALMMLINKDFIMVLFTDPLGKMLLAAGIVMQTLGYLVIRKIIHIKV